MTITYHRLMIQGSEEWFAARCGLLTASEMHLIYQIPKEETRIKKDGTPYKQREYVRVESDGERSHLYELLAQRITKYVEPTYIGDAMLRGQDDELLAVELYEKTYAPVERVGFVTNDKWGFTIGYSPDGMVNPDGHIEGKSRKQKLQVKTYIEYVLNDTIDPEFMIQVQTGLMVTERKWCDLVSYCGGLPMATVRVYPDENIQAAILEAAAAFEYRLAVAREKFDTIMASKALLIPTERKIYEEIY